MVDVEHGALRALEQHVGAGRMQVGELLGDVHHAA